MGRAPCLGTGTYVAPSGTRWAIRLLRRICVAPSFCRYSEKPRRPPVRRSARPDTVNCKANVSGTQGSFKEQALYFTSNTEIVSGDPNTKKSACKASSYNTLIDFIDSKINSKICTRGNAILDCADFVPRQADGSCRAAKPGLAPLPNSYKGPGRPL